ncbi:hypothetical protein D3C86_2077360 [compost metagenome]
MPAPNSSKAPNDKSRENASGRQARSNSTATPRIRLARGSRSDSQPSGSWASRPAAMVNAMNWPISTVPRPWRLA